MRRRPSLATAVGAGFVLWGLAIGLQRLNDNSFLTHLATGRLILERGIPRADPFSFTAPGHPWTVQSWLVDGAFALAERAGGGHGIQLLHAALTTLLAALIWRLSRPATTLAGRVLVCGAALVIGTIMWSERPLLVGLVLMAVLVLLAEADTPRPWLLLPVMWLWVNSHGSFPLALVYLAVRLAGRKADGQPVDKLARLAAVAVAGTVLGAVNPLGARLLLFPLKLLTDNQAFAHIVEWRSPDFSRPVNLLFLAVILGSLLLVLRSPSWEDALVVAVFGALGCIAVRNTAVASLVAVPVLSRGLDRLGSVRGDQKPLAASVVIGALAAVAVALTAGALRSPAYDLRAYPVDELARMEQRGLLEGRVMTQEFVGNLLTFRTSPVATKVFIDDRFDMYPDQVREDALLLRDGGEGWQERLDRYGITAVLWQRSKPLAGLISLDPGWEVVDRTDDWVVAVRAGGDPPPPGEGD